MLYREIIAVCSEIRTKHINVLCWLNVELLNVKPGGIYSDRCTLEGYIYRIIYIYIFIPYLAVNPLRLGYKNQSVNVVYRNNRCLF